MAAIRQGVWQKLTQNALGKDQPGQQKMVQAINEFLNGRGSSIARQLYTPEELALMKRYADAVKLTAIPNIARTNSDTAVAAMSAMRRYSGMILPMLGAGVDYMTGGMGIVGGVAGHGVKKMLEKRMDLAGDEQLAAQVRKNVQFGSHGFASGGAVKAPFANRAKYHYTADRGTAAEHCGNCSMFRSPHGCTAVGGWIVKKGKCDIWEKGREHRDSGGAISFQPYNILGMSPWSPMAGQLGGTLASAASTQTQAAAARPPNPPATSTIGSPATTQFSQTGPALSSGPGPATTQFSQTGPALSSGPDGMSGDAGSPVGTPPAPPSSQVGPPTQPGPRQSILPGAPLAKGGRIEHAPTDAQKEAGNYAKEHVRVHGLDISIENAKGSTRSGKGKNGKPWSVKMPAAYGYLRKTEGADGDHVDVYLGPHLRSDKVFVVNQRDADSKKFDEHKILIGFGSETQAHLCYLRGFSDGRGRERLGSMKEMTVEQFKDWLKNGDTSAPVKRAA